MGAIFAMRQTSCGLTRLCGDSMHLQMEPVAFNGSGEEEIKEVG
jgi:hypothetical protein